MIIYVYYDEGNFVEVVWPIGIKLVLQIPLLSLVWNIWWQKTLSLSIMSWFL